MDAFPLFYRVFAHHPANTVAEEAASAAAAAYGGFNFTGWHDGFHPSNPSHPPNSKAALKTDDTTPPSLPPSPWINKVHVVTLTHLDVGGYGPTATCEDDCKWASDVCDSYFDEWLPEAVFTAETLKAAGKQPVRHYTSKSCAVFCRLISSFVVWDLLV